MVKLIVEETADELLFLAESDIISAKVLFAGTYHPADRMYNIVCFHATQAVEKFLKGYIISCNKNAERTHNLDNLCKAAIKIDNSFKEISGDCVFLNTYSPDVKYTSKNEITKQDMVTILKSLETICIFPPIKTMRASFAKKHKYKIISKIITKPVSKTTAQIPKSIKPNNAEKAGKKRKKT